MGRGAGLRGYSPPAPSHVDNFRCFYILKLGKFAYLSFLVRKKHWNSPLSRSIRATDPWEGGLQTPVTAVSVDKTVSGILISLFICVCSLNVLIIWVDYLFEGININLYIIWFFLLFVYHRLDHSILAHRNLMSGEFYT